MCPPRGGRAWTRCPQLAALKYLDLVWTHVLSHIRYNKYITLIVFYYSAAPKERWRHRNAAHGEVTYFLCQCIMYDSLERSAAAADGVTVG
jgi:hypothetical protein